MERGIEEIECGTNKQEAEEDINPFECFGGHELLSPVNE